VLRYHHVDVFSSKPLNGNGLTIVFPDRPLPDATLLAITREYKQFETIFVYPPDRRGAYPARIFTVDEELAFAGHPILGAGAILHHLFSPVADRTDVTFALGEQGERLVQVHSRREENHYRATMNQGRPAFLGTVDRSRSGDIAAALNLREDDLDDALPIETVSTGLPYLLVPVRSGLAGCAITHDDFETFLHAFGAKFAYIFDAATLECRTWDNAAHAEDVATGSAAGPLCAYLVKHGLRNRDEEITIFQGRFAGRPSVLTGMVAGSDGCGEVFVSGSVSLFASGTIDL
jgi:PhzF family phenazine biosynthesis protein